MTSYANQATKQIIVSLSGAKGMADTLLKAASYRGKEKADQYLEIAKENLQLALNEICDGIDPEQLRGLVKYANGFELMLVPKHSPVTKNEEYIVRKEDLETLLYHATSECTFCELEGKEITGCPIRKALLASGIIPSGTKDCPYKT